MSPFCPIPGPWEGKGDIATSDFVAIVRGPPRRQGLCSPCAQFQAPIFLSPSSGTSGEGRGYVAIPPNSGPLKRHG